MTRCRAADRSTITAAVEELGVSLASVLPVAPGSYARLSVTDTGAGMDAQTKAHAFEPFFTTKAADRGTGLGLSTVLGIVQQSGGGLSLESEPGRGTTLTIYLPRTKLADANVGKREDSVGPPSRRASGAGTVLLVEDDDAVRGVAAKVLRRSGYTVLEAQNGGEALLHCEQHEGPIDILVTDIVMPRLDGARVAERLVQERPSLRVLYVSGHADKAIQERLRFAPGNALLQKPVTPGELLSKVRAVLAAKKSSFPASSALTAFGRR